MTIQKTNVVDWLGLEKDTGVVVLTIVDDDDWGDEHEHLRLLEAKLNTYLALIESGEVFERLALDIGRTISKATAIKVSILAKYALPSAASEFLTHAESTFHRAGFVLTHKVLPAAD